MPEQNDLEQQIAQRMAELPQDVRDAIASNDTGSRLQAIGQAHNLHLDQIGALSDEVTLAMLGFSEMDNLANNIAEQLKIPVADAQTIAGEVNQQLFLPIRESMKRFMEGQKASPAVLTPQISSEKSSEQAGPTFLQKPVVPPPPAAPKPAAPATPAMPMAEKLLTEKTVVVPAAPASTPPASPVAPKPIYKADPYREPVE